MAGNIAEERHQTDVLIVGGGAAGTMAAFECAQAGVSVIQATKGRATSGTTTVARGGFAAAMAPGDSPELHLQEILKYGGELIDPNWREPGCTTSSTWCTTCASGVRSSSRTIRVTWTSRCSRATPIRAPCTTTTPRATWSPRCSPKGSGATPASASIPMWPSWTSSPKTAASSAHGGWITRAAASWCTPRAR